MTGLRRRLGLLAGRMLEVLRPDLARALDSGDRSGRDRRLKGLILKSRLARARAAGDARAIGRTLAAFWRAETGDGFHETYRDRFEGWFLGPHHELADRLVALAAGGGFRELVEIGCGDGRVLAHLAARLPDLPAFTGIDINPAVIARNRSVHAGDPRLAFVAGEITAELPGRLADGTLLLSYGGVMEYLPPDELARIFGLLGARAPAAVALVEPVDPAHDLDRDARSHVHGAESSFSHPHRLMLEAAGFTVLYERRMDLDIFRWTMLLAARRPEAGA